MQFKVSVIIPFFNVEKYIDRCVNSLFNQSLDMLQFIFIDDCSMDNSRQILEKIIAKPEFKSLSVEILTHKVNKGLAASRNTGFDHALGEYIYHCDSDDWLESEALEKMYVLANKHNAEIIWTDFYFDFGKSNSLSKQKYVEDPRALVGAMMREDIHAGIWNKLYKRTFLLDAGIRSPQGNDMWEDMYYNLLLFSNSKKIAYLNQAFYHYNQQNTSSISKSKIKIRLTQICNNVDAVISYLDTHFAKVYVTEYSSLKLSAKKMLLFSVNIEDFRVWRRIYPEVNPKVNSMHQLPRHLRLVGYATYKGYWSLIYGWILLKKLVRWFR